MKKTNSTRLEKKKHFFTARPKLASYLMECGFKGERTVNPYAPLVLHGYLKEAMYQKTMWQSILRRRAIHDEKYLHRGIEKQKAVGMLGV